jgi:hypothetical protein
LPAASQHATDVEKLQEDVGRCTHKLLGKGTTWTIQYWQVMVLSNANRKVASFKNTSFIHFCPLFA